MEQVVIAGAGPIGLWLAAELRLHGVAAVVLEREADRDPRSKAISIQARTLDTFASRGIVDRFLAHGIKVPTSHFGGAGTRLDFAVLDTCYKHSLAIPQARTEQILVEYLDELNVDLRTGHTVTALAQSSDRVSIGVDGPDGKYTLEADWLIGCDGASSAVRRLAGFDFPGTSSEIFGWLADVMMASPPSEVRGRVDEKGTLMTAPIGDGVWRIAGITTDDMRRLKDVPLELDFVRRTMNEAFGTDFGLHSPLWLSRYGNATRQADRYRDRHVLLAGDAAHMFFPAGGQGLNTGILDAHNLGWKLAARINGWGSEALLDSYEEERKPAAQHVMRSTRAQLLLFAPEGPEQLAVRDVFSEALAQPDVNRMWAKRVGGYDIRYRAERQDDDEAHPALGYLAPDLSFGIGPVRSLYEALADGKFVLLDLVGVDGLADLAILAAERVRYVATDVDPRRLDWQGVKAAIVRPDGHLLWISSAHAPGRLIERAWEILAAWAGLPAQNVAR